MPHAADSMATQPHTPRPSARKLAAVPSGPTDPYATSERHHNEGHGRRLTAAFEALEAFPALAESRNQVMRLFEAGEPSTAEVVAAVEGDVALAVTVLRLANQLEGRVPAGANAGARPVRCSLLAACGPSPASPAPRSAARAARPSC